MTRTSALTHLNHPNIVPILDFGIEDGVAFIVMQYIPDGNLRQRHPRGTRIELAAVINYVQQISPAIQYIHDLGFVHRDIKPHNLLVDKNASIMLSDFGATIVSHSLSPIHVSQREFEGTAPYAAPEQLQGKPCRNSDQYALGVMIYEWLSGDWPFNGSFYEITHQHLFVAPPAFKERGLDCPPNIEQVIFRALEKEPARRFPNVKRFVEELAWATKVAQAKGLSCGPIITATAAKIPPASQVRRQFKSPFTFEPK